MLARQRPVGQSSLNGSQDHLGFRQPAGAIFAAGHLALIRAGEKDAIGPERRNIALGRRVLPHPHVHRRRHQHPRVGGQ